MPTTLIDDKVWWDRRRKLNGICKEVSAAIFFGQNILLLAHFEATLSEIEATLRSRSGEIEIERLARVDSSILCSGVSGKAWSGLARFLSTPIPSTDDWGAIKLQHPSMRTGSLINIIVAEHYPLRSRDEQLVAATCVLACEAKLTFHLSLDDPLLPNFGVVQYLGKRLGMDEETFLSHPMITRAIRQRQEKIERGVPRDLPAWSIEDWFNHNLPR